MAPTNDSFVDCSNRSHRIRFTLYTVRKTAAIKCSVVGISGRIIRRGKEEEVEGGGNRGGGGGGGVMYDIIQEEFKRRALLLKDIKY